MNISQIRSKLPELNHWIDELLAAHAGEARSVASLGFKRLPSYYSAALLRDTRFVLIDKLPAPPLRAMGLGDFSEMETMDALGTTFRSTYFVRRDQAVNESLHFHELVHVVQGILLGHDRFLVAYGLGHLQGGSYGQNPLEIIAYALEQRFGAAEEPFNVADVVRSDLVRTALPLLAQAGF